MPFATANDVLITEKLPGPQLTNIEKFLSNMIEDDYGMFVYHSHTR